MAKTRGLPEFLSIQWRRVREEEEEAFQDWIMSYFSPLPVAVVMLYSQIDDKTALLCSCCGWDLPKVEQICSELGMSVFVPIEEQVNTVIQELNRRLENEKVPPENLC